MTSRVYRTAGPSVDYVSHDSGPCVRSKLPSRIMLDIVIMRFANEGEIVRVWTLISKGQE